MFTLSMSSNVNKQLAFFNNMKKCRCFENESYFVSEKAKATKKTYPFTKLIKVEAPNKSHQTKPNYHNYSFFIFYGTHFRFSFL